MHDPLRVRVLEAARDALRDLERARQLEGATRPLELALDVPALEQLGHDVRRTTFLAEVEDADEVRVRAHPPHRLRLAHDPLPPHLVEAVGLDQGERDVAVEERVMREEHALAPALAEELPHLVPAGGERLGRRAGGGLGGGRASRGGAVPRLASAVLRSAGASSLSGSIARTARAFSATSRHSAARHRGLRLVEERVDTALDAFAGHDAIITERTRF